MKRIAFEKVAEDSGIKPPRIYAILGGGGRMSPLEFGIISEALGQKMEFFLPNNPEFLSVVKGEGDEKPEVLSN